MAFEPPPRKSFASHQQAKSLDQPQGTQQGEDMWLRRANEAFEISTTFLDTNYRKDWEDSIHHFQNMHMTGSKYHREEYRFRSRMFRPKTRSFVRQSEAAVAAAFFSQLDVLSVEAEDALDPLQMASAALRQELLNYRLSNTLDNPIKWFATCVGAMQDGNLYGLICSKIFWEYQDKDIQAELTDSDGKSILDGDGNPVTVPHKIKVKDHPQIDLLAIENIRFDPAAKWTDVVNTSPYLINMIPMRIAEVRSKIERGEWHGVDDKELMNARNAAYDTTRQARDGKREDATDPKFSKELSDFDIVWVHENIQEKDGEDVHFYTLSTYCRLSDPRPLDEVYLHGIRPFVIGTVVIESHRPLPDSPVHLAKGLQKEANEIANTRLDNVKLALNKRYLVRRGKQVDLQSLVRNAPGSVTLVNDTQGDVLPLEFQDVTQSSYAEQDRVNVDTDELLGSFSTGSIETNRKLGETVGGMGMLRGNANNMTQYFIRVFAETWVEPVMNHLDRLEQHYESDAKLLKLMAKRANIQRYLMPQPQPGQPGQMPAGQPGQMPPGQPQPGQMAPAQMPAASPNMDDPGFWEQLLMQPGRVTVNVANSAMDPLIRLQMFLQAMQQYTAMVLQANQAGVKDINFENVKEYIFGLLGIKGAKRFSIDLGNLPPEAKQLMAQMQQMNQVIQTLQNEVKNKQGLKMMDHKFKAMIEGMREESKRMMTLFTESAKTQREREVMGHEKNENQQDRIVQMAMQDANRHYDMLLQQIDGEQQANQSQPATAQ